MKNKLKGLDYITRPVRKGHLCLFKHILLCILVILSEYMYEYGNTKINLLLSYQVLYLAGESTVHAICALAPSGGRSGLMQL